MSTVEDGRAGEDVTLRAGDGQDNPSSMELKDDCDIVSSRTLGA